MNDVEDDQEAIVVKSDPNTRSCRKVTPPEESKSIQVPRFMRFMGALSRILQEKREEVGFSLTKLAELADVHETVLSNIENGSQNASIEVLSRLSEALGSNVEDIIQAAAKAARETSSPLKILLVEDNPPDIYMFKRCLKKSDLPTELTSIDTGPKAAQYLEELENSDGTKNPEIVFLDLNLPGKSGHDILKQIKQSQKLHHIPVIILTTSSNPKDVDKSQAEKANSYLTKPLDPFEFEKSVSKILNYWFALSSYSKGYADS